MYDAVTFHIEVTDMFGGKELERFDFAGGYIDVPLIARIVMYPYIFLIVPGDSAIFDIQFRVTT